MTIAKEGAPESLRAQFGSKGEEFSWGQLLAIFRGSILVSSVALFLSRFMTS